MTCPSIALSDETTIPQLGIGIWKIPPEDTERVVLDAFELGYRHIDAAQMYGNEEGVGAAIKNSGLSREEIHVTTKLNNPYHEPERARVALGQSLERLGVEQIDLFLIHWPLPTRYDGNFTLTWETMIRFREEGLVRSIGVSNFQPAHLDTIVERTGVTPVVNQVEVHPYFTNTAARAASVKHGARVEGWSPLGQGGGELTDPVVTALAAKYDKTPAQVVLRWHIDQGIIIFPKSSNKERLAQNFDIFDFSLTNTEIESISALDKGEEGRTGPDPDKFDWIPDVD